MDGSESAKPVVTDARLGRMKDGAVRPRRISGKILNMDATPKPDGGGKGRMAPFDPEASARQPRDRGEQAEPRAPTGAGAKRGSEGYVRLRLRVHGGDVTVVGAKAVEGPLASRRLAGPLLYEATLGSRRVAVGSVQDAGERRSFPHPKPEVPEMSGHHVAPVPSYEVLVRIPRGAVPVKSLPRLQVTLFRVKEPLPVDRAERLGPTPVAAQFTRELREVGCVRGIRPDRLESSVAAELRAAFG